MASDREETPLEHILTSEYKAGMIAYMHAHPEAFDEAIALAGVQKQPYSWRAAWLLWSCMEENDPRLRPHVKRFIARLSKAANNQRREFCLILQRMDLDAEDEGRLFDLCLAMWEDLQAQPSLRINALKLLVKIARGHPELHREIALLTQAPYTDSLSPAVRKSMSRIMKEFARAPRNPRTDRLNV